jgi:hypothetical protein
MLINSLNYISYYKSNQTQVIFSSKSSSIDIESFRVNVIELVVALSFLKFTLISSNFKSTGKLIVDLI